MRVNERIHRVVHGPFMIRIWCACEDLKDVNEAACIKRDIDKICKFVQMNTTKDELAELFAKLPFCNAVEVSVGDNGVLIYPDWP